MSRRTVAITLDNLDDLPRRCRRCVFWELGPEAIDRAGDPASGDGAELAKESWVSAMLLEWGSCGRARTGATAARAAPRSTRGDQRPSPSNAVPACDTTPPPPPVVMTG